MRESERDGRGVAVPRDSPDPSRIAYKASVDIEHYLPNIGPWISMNEGVDALLRHIYWRTAPVEVSAIFIN